MVSDPGYALLLVLHVILAVVGFGALSATGAYARAVRVTATPAGSEALRRFFRPGHNLAARAIFLVPVVGGVLIGLSGDSRNAYPWIGLGLWVVAVGVATARLWPSERQIQQLLASTDGDEAALAEACRRCESAATTTTVLFALALVVMIAHL